MRRRIHDEFARHSQVTDLEIIDKLRVKAEMEYLEYMLVHKTHHHVFGFLNPEKDITAPESLKLSGQSVKGASPFLSSFLKGESH